MIVKTKTLLRIPNLDTIQAADIPVLPRPLVKCSGCPFVRPIGIRAIKMKVSFHFLSSGGSFAPCLRRYAIHRFSVNSERFFRPLRVLAAT